LPDFSDNKNNGAGTGSTTTPAYVTSTMGPALSFDGDDYFDLGNLKDFASELNTHRPTVSYWINTTTSAQHWIFGTRNAAADTRFDHRINTTSAGAGSSGRLQLFIKDENGDDLIGGVDVDTGLNDGTWHHIALSAGPSSDVIAFYVDGISQAITYDQQDTPSSFANFTKTLYLGGFNDGGAPLSPYVGNLLDFRIYNRVLTVDEVWQLYAPETRWELYEPVVRQWVVGVTAAPPAPTGARTLPTLGAG